MMQRQVFTMTGTSPAAAGQAIVGAVLGGLSKYDWFQIDADLVGATGGVLNIYLQRKLATDVWVDWVSFPQQAGGGSEKWYSLTSQSSASISVVGKTKDDGTTGAPALTANTIVGGHPGDSIRLVAVAGSGTSAGAAVTIYVSAFKSAT